MKTSLPWVGLIVLYLLQYIRRVEWIGICLILLFSTNFVFSQPHTCGTNEAIEKYKAKHPSEYKESLKKYNDFIYDNVKKAKLLKGKEQNIVCPGGIVIIPIAFHVFHDGEPIGHGYNYSVNDLRRVLDQLNNDFSGYEQLKERITQDFQSYEAGHTCIQFAIGKINRIETSSCSKWKIGATHTDLNACLPGGSGKGSANDPSDYLNVYITALDKGFLGIASSIPPLFGKTNANDDGVSINRDILIPGQQTEQNYNRGSVLSHEIGHWLGLPHVNGDINGSGCDADDGFSDTFMQSDLRFFFCNDDDVPQSCGSIDNVYNFMDYSADCAKLMFTEQQALTMREVLKKERYKLSKSFSRGNDDRLLYNSSCRIFESNSSLFEFNILDCYGEINLLEYQTKWYPAINSKSNSTASLTLFTWREQNKGGTSKLIQKSTLARNIVEHQGDNYMDVRNYTLYMQCWDPYSETYSNQYPAGQVMVVLKKCKMPENDKIENALTIHSSNSCKEILYSMNNASPSEEEMLQCSPWKDSPDVWFKMNWSNQNSVEFTLGSYKPSTSKLKIQAYAHRDSTWQCLSMEGHDYMQIENAIQGEEIYVRVYSSTDVETEPFWLCLTQNTLKNDICSSAIELEVVSSCSPKVFHNIGAQASGWPNNKPICGRIEVARDIWFTAVVPSSGHLNIETFYIQNGVEEIIMEAYSGNCEYPEIIACSSIKKYTSDYDRQALIQLTDRTPGEIIYLRVIGNGESKEGEFGICTYSEPISASCRIQLIEVEEQSPCNGITSSYEQKLKVYYQESGYSDKMYINNQAFALTGSPQTIVLTNLPADGKPISIIANMSNSQDQDCWQQSLYKAYELFTSPEACYEGKLLNDDCSGAIELTPKSKCENHIFSNVGATYSVEAPKYFHCGVSGYKPADVWFKGVIPQNGQVTVSAPLLYNENNMILEVYVGSCDDMMLIDCDQFGGKAGSEIAITDGIPGETIFIRVADQGSNTQGDFALCVTSESPNSILGSKDGRITHDPTDNNISKTKEVDFLIFPNPASNHISIEKITDNESIDEVKLYNAQGLLLKSMKYHPGTILTKMNLDNNLSNGQYYLSIITMSGIKTKPFVLMR